MEWTVERYTTIGRNGLKIAFDGEEVTMDGYYVREYNREEDNLYLHSRHDELQLNTKENQIILGVGDATLRISVPGEFVEEVEQHLEMIPEYLQTQVE